MALTRVCDQEEQISPSTWRTGRSATSRREGRLGAARATGLCLHVDGGILREATSLYVRVGREGRSLGYSTWVAVDVSPFNGTEAIQKLFREAAWLVMRIES